MHAKKKVAIYTDFYRASKKFMRRARGLRSFFGYIQGVQ